SQQMAELIGRTLNVPEHDMSVLMEQARGYKSNGSNGLIPPTEALREHLSRIEASGQGFELPWPFNSALIGREQEIEAISKLLMQNDVRLLTLVGAGGIGKTRLGVEVARKCLPNFKGGTYIVMLAAVSNPDLFMSSVMAALDLQSSASPGTSIDPRQAVHNYLRERQALIFLDNMEHLLGCAPQVAELLKACPQIKILVTSREPLQLAGEKQYQAPPLSNAPMEKQPEEDEDEDGADKYSENSPPESSDTASYYSKYEAVRLFVKRAQDIDRTFELTDENAYYVARICWELDGLPLAIELAASQSKMLTPRALYKRLSKQLRLALRGPSDLPDRQRTLRGAIGWSYSLLNEQERKLFRRLSVFDGGSSLDAIEAICLLPGDESIDVYEVVGSLINKSLLGREIDGEGEPRFFMLKTTKEYAIWRLDDNKETEEMRRRHANYFVTLAENAEPALTSPRRSKWLNRLDAELFNMHAAMGWALTHDPDQHEGSIEANKRAEIALRIAGALNWYWYLRGRIKEGRDWLTKALAATQVIEGDNTSIAARAAALDAIGRMSLVQGQESGVVETLAESVMLWRQTNNKRGLAYALSNLSASTANLRREQDTSSVALLNEAIALFKQLDDKWGTAYSLDLMG
ncbi:MAG: NB-ARC domain-containing protein, partial [Chloroflexia bacterium]